MSNIEKIIVQHAAFHKAYDEIVERISDYSDTCAPDEVSDGGYGDFYLSHAEEEDDDLADIIFSQYIDIKVLRSSHYIASFIKKYHHSCSESTLEVLHNLVKNPVYWAAYKIEEFVDTNLFQIVDIFTGERNLLFSTELADCFEVNKDQTLIFHSMLVDVGPSLISFGEVYYSIFQPEDIAFILSILDPEDDSPVTKNKVSDCVFDNYFAFSMIELIEDSIPLRIEGNKEIYSFSLHSIGKKDIAALEKSGAFILSETSDEVDSYTIGEVPSHIRKKFLKEIAGGEEFLLDLENEELTDFLSLYLYVHKTDHEILISSHSQVGYVLMRYMIEDIITLRRGLIDVSNYDVKHYTYPQYFNDMVNVHKSFFYSLPIYYPPKILPISKFLSPFVDHFAYYGVDEDDEDSVNMLLREMMASFHEGREIDYQHLSNIYDIDVIDVIALHDVLKTQLEKNNPFNTLMTLSRDFPLEKVGKIQSRIKLLLNAPLEDNILLTIVSKEDEVKGADVYALASSLSNQSTMKMIDEYDFTSTLQIMGQESFGEKIGDLLLNTIIYIMKKHEGEWIDVVAICLNIMQNFEYPLFNTYGSENEAIEQMSNFIYTKMCSSGFLEIKERVKRKEREMGEYKVRTTLLFSSLISLTQL